MHLKVFKEDIIDGLQKAANIIPQRTGAAYLRTIWLRTENGKLEILSTDSNIEFRGSYTAEVMEDGLVGVQGRTFVELLRRLPGGQMTLKTDSDAPILRISQGRGNYNFAVNDITWFQKFSDFPEEGAVLWSGDFLNDLIDRIAYCIGDEGSDALGCLLVKPADENRIEAAGMNGHQFAMSSFTNDDLRELLPEEGILIQKKYLNELKKWLSAEEISLNLSDKRLFLRTEKQREFFSLPLSSYQYPDYSVFLGRLEEEGVCKLSLTRTDMQNALMRIAVFNSETNRCTYFDLSEKEVQLSATGQEVGSAAEVLDAEYKGDIEKIAFPTGHLLTILDHYSSQSLTFTLTGQEGPCGISGSDDLDYLVIIMPMKILEDINFSEEQV